MFQSVLPNFLENSSAPLFNARPVLYAPLAKG